MSDERDYFALRYYQWSVNKLRDELATGFARVASAPVNSGGYLLALDHMLPSEREATAFSLVKLGNRRGAELSGSPLSANEELLLRRFTIVRAKASGEEVARLLYQPRPRATQIRRLLVKQLKEELPATLGDSDRQSRLWFYRREFKGHLVTTVCDATGSEKQYDFAYGHDIRGTDGDWLHRNVNWLSWLGLSGQTQWRPTDEDQIPTVITTVKELMKTFLDALPSMLPDAPSSEA